MLSLIGFFVFGPQGELVGLVIALLTIFFVFLFGDKLFLVCIGAKEVESKRVGIYDRLENLACLNELEGVRLYQSFDVPVNVLCIHPLVGMPCVVFSNEVLEANGGEFVESALSLSMELINKKALKGINTFVFVANLVLLPKFFFNHFRLKRTGALVGFFLLPIAFLKDFISQATLDVIHSDRDERYLRISYFLEKYSYSKESLVMSLADDFSIIKRTDYGLWNQLRGSKPIKQQPSV